MVRRTHETSATGSRLRATDEDRPFWEAAARGELMLTRCDACEVVIWYPRPFCPVCGHWGGTELVAAGQGTVYSYTVVRRAQGPFRELAPYIVAYVELDEGPRILTNIVDCDPTEVCIGARVVLRFDDRQLEDPATGDAAGDEVRPRLYRFRLQTGTQPAGGVRNA